MDCVQKRKQLKTVLTQSDLDKEQLKRRMEEEMDSVKAQAAQGSLSLEEFHKAETAIVCLSKEVVSRGDR